MKTNEIRGNTHAITILDDYAFFQPGKTAAEIMRCEPCGSGERCDPARIMELVGSVLLKCDAALFMPEDCHLWIGGQEVALVRHSEEGCGHEFDIELIEKQKDGK